MQRLTGMGERAGGGGGVKNAQLVPIHPDPAPMPSLLYSLKKPKETSPFCKIVPKSGFETLTRREARRRTCFQCAKSCKFLPLPKPCPDGRSLSPPPKHILVNGRPLAPPYPDGFERVLFGMGCFWGAERKFWQQGEGVYVTAVGYAGITPNPTYEEVCSGMTGHTEAVLVVFDPAKMSFGKLLALFWESHDPTQGMRQGNDRGTQYRSAIYTTTEAQAKTAAERKFSTKKL